MDTGAGGIITAIADAIGPREMFEPVFQEGKAALLGFNSCFLTADPSNDRAICENAKAGTHEMVAVSAFLSRVLFQKTIFCSI